MILLVRERSMEPDLAWADWAWHSVASNPTQNGRFEVVTGSCG
jgi:hypothetical protein